MQLTGKQIAESGIVTNLIEKSIQQQGVDVRLMKVDRVLDNNPTCSIEGSVAKDIIIRVPVNGKTTTPHTEPCDPMDVNGSSVWWLNPGYYEVTFEEACNIPANYVLNYRTRSSLVRCGAIIHSGQFDGGFKTDHMGAFLQVIKPITIEKGARVAQAVVTESYPVDSDKLYNGQWQNDNQRQG